MSTIEFRPWPKTPRLNRGMIVTEKLDGSNAAVVIVRVSTLIGDADGVLLTEADVANQVAAVADGADDTLLLFAQSRKRFVTPGASTDNFGFAAWVAENAEQLVATLGEGIHYGEWYGRGVQRGYGLTERRFALFNTHRWEDTSLTAVPGLEVVPVLYRGAFDTRVVDEFVADLAANGSVAVPGFKAEGLIVFHVASRTSSKVLCEGDDVPKGVAA